jgi:hypothetical protein
MGERPERGRLEVKLNYLAVRKAHGNDGRRRRAVQSRLKKVVYLIGKDVDNK